MNLGQRGKGKGHRGVMERIMLFFVFTNNTFFYPHSFVLGFLNFHSMRSTLFVQNKGFNLKSWEEEGMKKFVTKLHADVSRKEDISGKKVTEMDSMSDPDKAAESWDIRSMSEWIGFSSKDYSTFLKEYWGKRPLLIRKAIDKSNLFLNPEELVHFAMQDDTISRLIWKEDNDVPHDAFSKLETDSLSQWKIKRGPFEAEEFVRESKEWTVLVQEMDRHIPELSDIMTGFQSFLPSWRLDDIQVSYAPTGGGIGPHVDNYDVFLVQGRGLRRWSIENKKLSVEEEHSRLVRNSEVRTLDTFDADFSWILEPGDMLYLPPRVPHEGISIDDQCMTYSVGFRAPRLDELITEFTSTILKDVTEEEIFYKDGELSFEDSDLAGPLRGEISQDSILKMKEMVRSKLLSYIQDAKYLDKNNAWIGKLLTKPRRRSGDREVDEYPIPFYMYETVNDLPWHSVEEVMLQIENFVERQGLEVRNSQIKSCIPAYDNKSEINEATSLSQIEKEKSCMVLYQAEGVKFAYIDAHLFIDGHIYDIRGIEDIGQKLCHSSRLCPKELITLLLQKPPADNEDKEMSTSDVTNSRQRKKSFYRLLSQLLNEGYIYPSKENFDVQQYKAEDREEM